MSSPPPAAGPAHGVSLREACGVWTRIAALSFGGPAAQIAVMHRILVEERRWISERRFLHALNFCMFLPGPEAQQLAIYIGWLMHRTIGGVVAGGLFVLPGAVSILGLSFVYALFGHVGWIVAAFFGLKSAVLAIVLEALGRIAARALKTRTLGAVAAASFVLIFFFNVPFPLLIAAAAAIGLIGARAHLSGFRPAMADGRGAEDNGVALLGEQTPEHARPSVGRALRDTAFWLAIWLAPVAGLEIMSPTGGYTDIATFFAKVSAVTFGGAYSVLAYVAQQAVERYHWLAPGEMLDGLGMAETTPGPLVTVLQFVGFLAALRAPGALPPLLAATCGALLTTWAIFMPSFLWIFVGGPFMEDLRENRSLTGALTAITAAVVGVILNLAIWFAIHAMFHRTQKVVGLGFSFDAPVFSSIDVAALGLTALAALAIFVFRIGMAWTLAISVVAGLTLHAFWPGA